MGQKFRTEATELIIGTAVVCADGALGELSRLVVDPVTVIVTNLVVGARYRQGSGRHELKELPAG